MATEARKSPIGIELVRRGIATQEDIEKAMEYQSGNPGKKIGDILYILDLCDQNALIEVIGESLGEKGMILRFGDIGIDITEYISIDVAKQNKVIPFEISGGKVKVCFADTANKRTIETVRLLFLNKGLVIEKYITFESIVETVLESFEGKATKEDINVGKDVTTVIDTVIKTGMEKRASDIHIEPMEKDIKVRYRIDGELITIATLEKEKQPQIIGRLKAISNMHQEKQESQDGRIITYPDYNIRVSSQKNIYGEKFVLRLLKKNGSVKRLFDLGFPGDNETVDKAFNKKNSVTIIAAPTGEGKTTTLYSVIDYLNNPNINITTIEDPVEIRIGGLNQIEIDAKSSFSGALRTVLRQDPDIILVGEIRDLETAEIAMQSGQTGHYVLSTIHTIDTIEVVSRLRKIGISNYDIASTLATAISQRLIRKLCVKCRKERNYTAEELEIFRTIGEKYNVKFDLNGKKTFDAVGCKTCNNIGYYDRVGAFEILSLTDEVKEVIVNNGSAFEIRQVALSQGYLPLVVDGLRKVEAGITDLQEINKKLLIF